MRLLYSTKKEDSGKAFSNPQDQAKEIAKSWRLAKRIIKQREKEVKTK